MISATQLSTDLSNLTQWQFLGIIEQKSAREYVVRLRCIDEVLLRTIKAQPVADYVCRYTFRGRLTAFVPALNCYVFLV